MNITNRTTHDVQQGTGAWLRLREGFFTASEAPAALGVSKYVTRAELLRRKHTGVPEEHSAATLGKFAAGHEAEARARPLAEDIAASELFPVTMTAEVDGLQLLASLDGLTLDDEIAWETKLWNEELAADVCAGTLAEHYTVQMDQELLVSGARRCLFTCTDGTSERFVSCWYEPTPERFAALLDGWRHFARDLAAYVLPKAEEAVPVGRAPETLPALRIEVTGAVTASNLAEFKQTALNAIRSVNRELRTDQDFADAEKAVKWCSDVETRLDAAKAHALSQTSSIDALFRAIDDISAEARRVRLDLDKLVTRRKGEVKDEAVLRARRTLDERIATLNAEIAPMRLPAIAADFAAAIKGKRSIASMQDALDGVLATATIAAEADARAIRANVATFHGIAVGFEFLFADLGAVIHKAADDFRLLVEARIATHKAAEADRARKAAEAEAARIAAAEQRAREQEAARIAEQQRQQAEEVARAATAAAQAAAKNIEAQQPQQVLKAEPATADATDRGPAVTVSPRGGAMGAGQAAAAAPAGGAIFHAGVVEAMRTQAVRRDEPATLNLGAICGRLGFTVSAAFLADTLHIQPAKVDKASRLYTESQYQAICRQIVSHVSAMAELYERTARAA
ncbi:MAG: YqaJ viral recombinase family protein [Burkholderiales bacterium]|nr:YqaJ viral recombinase family protein [Burkholderiales bacterium]